MKIVGIGVQLEKLGHHVLGGPRSSENDSELLQVVDRCLSNSENLIFKPGDADRVQLVAEEGLSKLSSEHWELLNDREFYSPVLVLAQLGQRGDNRLLKLFNADNFIEVLKTLEQIKSDFRVLVSQEVEENGQHVIVCGCLLYYRADREDVLGEGTPHICEFIGLKLFQVGHNLGNDALGVKDLAEVGETTYGSGSNLALDVFQKGAEVGQQCLFGLLETDAS